MLARTPWAAMRHPQLITPEMAQAAALRGWLAEDARHAVLAVIHRRYGIYDALHFLIGVALGLAEKARMDAATARKVAVAMVREGLTEQDSMASDLLWEVVDAIRDSLEHDPDDLEAAGAAAAVIVRDNNGPPGLIAAGMRIATRER